MSATEGSGDEFTPTPPMEEMTEEAGRHQEAARQVEEARQQGQQEPSLEEAEEEEATQEG